MDPDFNLPDDKPWDQINGIKPGRFSRRFRRAEQSDGEEKVVYDELDEPREKE